MSRAWPTSTLGEVCEFRGGGTPPKAVARYWRGDIPWVSPKDMKSEIVADSQDHISSDAIENSATSLIPRDSVLMVVRSGILARTVPIAITGRELTINQDLKALCPNGALDARFLYHLLASKMDELLSLVSRGATVHRLATEQVRAVEVVLPPLPEQRRIVRILDEAFEGIATAKANAERNVQNARAVFESHLQSIFTDRGKGWVEKRLGDVVTRLTNGYVGPTRNIYHASGVPYLLARHVRDNRLEFDEKTFITEAFNRKNKKSTLRTGDVLLVQSGHIGHSAVVTAEHDGHNCHAMIVITPVEGAFIGPFLSLFFNSPGMKRKFQEIRSGSTVPHLTCGEVRELKVALPDLATQQRVVTHSLALEADTERLARLHERKLIVLESLKKSLLHEAFSGNL